MRESVRPLYHYSNLINIPTDKLVQCSFNEAKQPIRISGVYEAHHDFFRVQEALTTLSCSTDFFETYMRTTFNLDVKRMRNGKPKAVTGWDRLLRGWFYDSSGLEGAVLKGWVEHRFGIIPCYHKGPINGINTPEYYQYMVERMDGRVNNNAVFLQLDLLYTYVQYAIGRFFPRFLPGVTLYRGINHLETHQRLFDTENRVTLWQNALTSFSLEKEVAGQFGDIVLQTWVPASKLFFFTDLFPHRGFHGESEAMVLGGYFDTRVVAEV